MGSFFWVTKLVRTSPEFSPTFGCDLSRLVHQRAARKPISDARTATYVILCHGSGPGGRRFKSFRPDHSLNDLRIWRARVLHEICNSRSSNHVCGRLSLRNVEAESHFLSLLLSA